MGPLRGRINELSGYVGPCSAQGQGSRDEVETNKPALVVCLMRRQDCGRDQKCACLEFLLHGVPWVRSFTSPGGRKQDLCIH